MVTNYYVKKLIRFIKNQFIFDFLVSCIFFKLLLIVINPVIKMSTFSYKMPNDFPLPKKTIIINSHYMYNIKIYYYIMAFIAIVFLVNDFYVRFLKRSFENEKPIKPYDVLVNKYPYDKDIFQYILGLKHKEDSLNFVDNPIWYKITESGLYQNVLCIGTIGQGKTIAELVQVLVQMIFYKYDDPKNKTAMLCLDVKGNFYKFVHGFAKEANRWDDVITIELGGRWKYNPVHKPNLSPVELSNRIRYILELFSAQTNETYWIDKGEDTITELIKLIRIYNNNYVDFQEIHFCASDDDYRNRKLIEIQRMCDNDILNEEQKYSYISARNYFKNEFDQLDTKAQGFIKSEITRITQPFVSTKIVKETFCPSRDEINFYGFEDVIKKGQIVVWKINANKEPKIAKLIAAYLKLDYQKEILITLDGKDPVALNRNKVTICDEYQEYVTANDAEFLSQSREPRSVTFATTQSYTSLKKALKNDDITNMLLQSFVNKIWLRTDDEWTVKRIMTQTGKEEKEKMSTTLTESSRQSRASYSLGRILGRGKNLSSGINIQDIKENRFDEKFLMQVLDAYKCVAFISDGKKIQRPTVVHLTPMFEGRISLQDNKIVYTDDEKLIFKNIGDVDIDKIENVTITELKDSELINSEKELLEAPKSKELIFKDDITEKGIDEKIENDYEKHNEITEKQPVEKNLFDDILK